MITRRDIMWAIANIDYDGETDVFPYRRDFNELIADSRIEDTIKKVFEMNRDITRLSASQFSQKHNIRNIYSTVREKGGGVRNVTLIDPLLNIYYLALAIRIRKKSPVFHPHSFSNIYPEGNDESPVFKHSNFGEFCSENYWMAVFNRKQYSLILKLDIANYFDSISIDLIERAITCTDVDKLCALLHVIGSCGLPVGGNASRIIGELIGAHTDKWLIKKKIHFNRCVDDYLIFIGKKRDPFDFLTEFEGYLSQLGFRLNHVKTKAYPIDLNYIFRLPVLEIRELLLSGPSGTSHTNE